MPSFIKDELKKKDEQKLDEMQKEIDAAEAPDEEAAEAKDADGVDSDAAAADAPAEQAGEEGDGSAEALSARAEQLAAELQEKDDRIKRLQADFENFRRRTAKEKEELNAVVTQGIFTDMLPLLDNFGRAMSAEAKDIDGFRQGVDMIYQQFQEVLKKHGLEEIKTEGAKFDPNFHQAVMRVENPDLEDDTIAAELQKGYLVKGRVVRPSMVQVVANG